MYVPTPLAAETSVFTTQPLFRIGPAVYPRHLLVGKFLAMLLIGTVLGYLLWASMAGDAIRGAELSREAYIENYDTYKAELMAAETPMAGMVVGGILLVVGSLVTYEALAVFLSWGVAWLAPGAAPRGRDDQDE